MAGANPGANFAPNAYAMALVSGKPRDSLNAIQQRLKKAKIFNDELADYFAARRELEEAYLKQLQKIAKKNFLSDPSSIAPGYVPVYERLIHELSEVADIHGELERRIAQECETVLRDASNAGEWSRLREHDDSLGNTIRELNSLEAQLAKDQKKVEAASAKKAGQAQTKVQETERAIAQTIDIWETEAPFAFESYQRVDAQRLELLKEVVAKFETAQSDAAQRQMQLSERTMQECLNFDAQADMQEFILQNSSTGGSGYRNGRTTGGPVRRESVAGRSISSRTGVPPSMPSRTNGMEEFGASSASIHSGDRTAGTISESTPSKSGGSTLRSAFSRLGRRKDKDSSNTQSTYGSLSGDSRSRADSGSRPVTASASRPSQLGAVGEDSLDSAPEPAGSGLMAPMTPSTADAGRATPRVQPPPIQVTTAAPPEVDAEGFSIPPPDRKPWELGGAAALGAGAGAAAAAGAGAAGATSANGGRSLMDGDDSYEDQDTVGSVGLGSKVSNMNISNRPITESSDKDKAALERVRSTLLTSGPPQRRATTSRRDSRDVRNTTYMPGSMGVGADDARMSQFGGGATAASPGTMTPTSPFGGQSAFVGQPGLGDHRTQSMASMASTNPFENSSTAAAVRASLTERVNVIFAGRDVSKVMVVGELSISVRDISPSSKPLHLRLDAFEQLDKAAPNPAFLQPVADKPGEYLLDVKSLFEHGASSGLPGSGGQAVVLKYQVHVSETRKAEFVPLSVHSQWRCEAHQTSFLLSYSANPSSRLVTGAGAGAGSASGGGGGSEAAMLQDLQFAVQVQPSTVTGVMTKPTGTWSAESRTMFWKLTEGVSLPAAQEVAPTTHKLLARFQIDATSGGITAPQPVFVKWKLVGRTLSTLGVRVLDVPGTSGSSAEGALRIDEVVRQTVSGKYISGP
ncbi:uncharacterized protein PFL1_01808 [Pseudozyma flocculosa PF-1]|uniref:uncharacterized protein n=1 Tax=Pseudozyma flocculosa PF-1 TaxID=1277687 RepID=UPI0004561401|nr:uncharacterized protein PFL1_01808 [Pseudozyma flocculosa PF-1]EPQ30910.1 hypothetical protein PFL1_01808 [Pseudozyma flocculosa PF-1]